MTTSLVDDLKKRLALLCCDSILNPPLPFVGALRIRPDDPEDVKDSKRKEHEEKTQQRELERIRREPELLEELDNIMKRVYASRNETLPEDSGEYNFGVKSSVTSASSHTSLGKFGLPSYYCEICKNREYSNFVTDLASGDTICLGR